MTFWGFKLNQINHSSGSKAKNNCYYLRHEVSKTNCLQTVSRTIG